MNRVLTDQVADLLLAPSPDAVENLLHEGIARSRIFLVGNVMIDSLLRSLDQARALGMPERMGLRPGQYAVCTLHRPSNVDDGRTLSRLLDALAEVGQRLPVVFPVHPRTRQALERNGLWEAAREARGLLLAEPLGYLEFLGLTSQARLVLTDSGGLQEETTALGIPCLTLRESTERPITVTAGTNALVGTDPGRILDGVSRVLGGEARRASPPALWDGRAGERIAALYEDWLDHAERAAPGPEASP